MLMINLSSVGLLIIAITIAIMFGLVMIVRKVKSMMSKRNPFLVKIGSYIAFFLIFLFGAYAIHEGTTIFGHSLLINKVGGEFAMVDFTGSMLFNVVDDEELFDLYLISKGEYD